MNDHTQTHAALAVCAGMALLLGAFLQVHVAKHERRIQALEQRLDRELEFSRSVQVEAADEVAAMEALMAQTREVP